MPGGAGEESFAGGLDFCHDAVGEGVIFGRGGGFAGTVETDEALVDLRFPDNFGSFKCADSGDECVSVVAGAFDEVGYALSAELTEGGVGGEAPGAAGPLWIPVHLIAGVLGGGEVRGALGDGGAGGWGIGYEGGSSIEGKGEPPWAVGGTRG